MTWISYVDGTTQVLGGLQSDLRSQPAIRLSIEYYVQKLGSLVAKGLLHHEIDDPCEPRCYFHTLLPDERMDFVNTRFLPKTFHFLRLSPTPTADPAMHKQTLALEERSHRDIDLQSSDDDISAFIKPSSRQQGPHSPDSRRPIDEDSLRQQSSPRAADDLAIAEVKFGLVLVRGLGLYGRSSDPFAMSRTCYVSVFQAFRLPNSFLSVWKSGASTFLATHGH